MYRGVVLLVSGASATLHVPFMLHSFACIGIFLCFPFICMHVPFMLHSCPFISFLQLWKWLYGLARGPSTINGYRSLIAKVIAKWIPPTYDIVRRKSATKTTEKEREGGNNKKIQRLDAKWYGNCRKQGTTGWISLIGFCPFCECAQQYMFVLRKKNNGLPCLVPGYRFWEGPIALQCFVHISDKKLLQY